MPELDLVLAIAIATLGAGTPLLLAALGELVSEKSGVLNLGVEGMMLMGAAVGFAVAAESGHFAFATLCGVLAGVALALVFGFLVLTCRANQVAAGLALTIFGIGASALVGAGYTSRSLPAREAAGTSFVADLPVVGPLLGSLEALTWLSLACFAAIAWFLYRSRPGLVLRAVGDAPDSAHAVGYPVIAIRYLAVLFGGAMAGLGGVFLSVYYTPTWVENMTAGRGWIAVALVVFASWRPAWVLAGAYLFGGVTIVQFHLQGVVLASQIFSMLPYLATIAVLVAISPPRRGGAPARARVSRHPLPSRALSLRDASPRATDPPLCNRVRGRKERRSCTLVRIRTS